jgi:hypothetical protein
MAGSPSFLIRLWRLYLGRNPLLTRPWDRAERVVVVLAVLLALTGVPFAALVGSETAARGIERAHHEMSTRHPGVAVTLAEAPQAAVSVRGAATTTEVAATWVAPDGTQRMGSVPVNQGTKVGAEEPIWMDDAGNQASAPFPPSAAIATGIANGVLTWLAVLAALTGSCWLAHMMLNRFRYAQWSQEWERLGHNSSYS